MCTEIASLIIMIMVFILVVAVIMYDDDDDDDDDLDNDGDEVGGDAHNGHDGHAFVDDYVDDGENIQPCLKGVERV